MDVFEAIEDRRSVRHFISTPVEEEKIIKILDAARWAPSAGNVQDCEFIVVRNRDKILQLAEAAYGQYWMTEAPVVIVVCTKLEKIARIYGDKGKTLYTVQDAAAATQNMLLAAHALGLGATWVSGFDEESVKRILRIPDNVKVHILVPIGYPAEKPKAPHRLGLDVFVHFDEYGNKHPKERVKHVWG